MSKVSDRYHELVKDYDVSKTMTFLFYQAALKQGMVRVAFSFRNPGNFVLITNTTTAYLIEMNILL